jgi:hypothetical protein
MLTFLWVLICLQRKEIVGKVYVKNCRSVIKGLPTFVNIFSRLNQGKKVGNPCDNFKYTQLIKQKSLEKNSRL